MYGAVHVRSAWERGGGWAADSRCLGVFDPDRGPSRRPGGPGGRARAGSARAHTRADRPARLARAGAVWRPPGGARARSRSRPMSVHTGLSATRRGERPAARWEARVLGFRGDRGQPSPGGGGSGRRPHPRSPTRPTRPHLRAETATCPCAEWGQNRRLSGDDARWAGRWGRATRRAPSLSRRTRGCRGGRTTTTILSSARSVRSRCEIGTRTRL